MKVTIQQLAELTGVSPATVSKVIHNYPDVGEETKEKIMQAIKETGYAPKQNSYNKKAKTIGVIYAVGADIKHPFFIDVIDSFAKEIGEDGYNLLFFSSKEETEEATYDYLARCLEADVAGCIIIGGDEIQHYVKELDQSNIPCIGVDIELTGDSSGYLMSDNKNIGKKVVEHFYLLGHREIAFIGGLSSMTVGLLRKQGFYQAMAEFGLDVQENWVEYGDFKESSGYEAMKRLLQKPGPLPSALFAAGDLMAIGAIQAIKEHGLSVPEDIAVIGCDDIDLSRYVTPALTTIHQNTQKIGKLAAHMLEDFINGSTGSSSVMVDSDLVIRSSCGNK
ncbi:LacI family DNA-binding transcriptional regulator [Radiobacillus deserti]|uniref:LacI family transcriptional regulator n=1 Tax=Radiobacillus deserti TaxID=2594883 RepID=A0A516KJS5_9BACI|nr:LacI family DNA-binding transcriptional regulator [Radiobacillus deserti]QDP41631.1 LacI family transcriptional regulator [Radiobacillus deserti]